MTLKITLFVKNFTILIIVISALINLISGSKYEKYVRYIVGMVIAVYVLTGIMSIFRENTIKEFELPGSYYDDCIEKADQVFKKTYEETVSKQVMVEMTNALTNAGFYVKNLECYYEEGNGYYVRFQTNSKENINVIKKYICDFYQFDMTHIYGYTEDKNSNG